LVANPKRGYFSKESGVTLVRNNLRQLLLTTKGERVMLPDFGTNLKYFLFEPLDKFTVQNIRDDILLAINKYAPGVKVVSLRVYPSQSISMEGLQGLYINLTVQVEELNQQTLDVNVEIG
jgi:phage baseplate assembly protein W